MQASDPPTIAADDKGIHFLRVTGRDIVVFWSEIESIDAVQYTSTDGATYHEVYINHLSGVDFRFHSVESGYADVLLSMEQHLAGFSRSTIESAGSWEEKSDQPFIWKRDETVQPFELEAPVVDPRQPTDQERVQMAAAHQASVAICERILGRPLLADELKCVHTGFENARIVGGVSQPLSDLLLARQSETPRNG